MSTTTSRPSSAATEGECVVCGKVCSTRCSSCSQQGLEWMYFCSVEHQRLIWFTHKRTCGFQSQPFQWPVLSKEEREDCYRFKDVEYTNSSGDTVTFAERIGVPFELLMEIVAGDSFDPQVQDISRSMHLFLFIRLCRQANKELSTLASPDLKELQLRARMAHHPYGFLAEYLESAWFTLRNLEGRSYDWYSDLHHRLVVFIALICRNYQNPERYREQTGYVKYAVDQVVKIIDNRVSKDRPEEAQNFKAIIKATSFKVMKDVQTGEPVGLVHMPHFMQVR